ncbi:MAG: dephospho-CoA kinase, partial [Oscillospiraceae bacterium]
ATIVFEYPELLKRLNMLIFPYIIASLKQEIAFLRKLKPTAIVLDAPTLFESRADYLCDYKISIIAQKKIRIQRIMARDGLSLEQAHHRIDAQHTDDYYREQSDYTLCNHGDIPSFLEKAKSLLNQIILSYNNSNKMLK